MSLRVRFETDDNLQDDEVVIHARKMTSSMTQMMQQLESQAAPLNLAFYQGDAAFYFPVQDILFFETDDRQIQAHTETRAYTVHYRLYKLEELLPNQFIRVSKSTILNVTKIYALTRSISTWQVTFQNSHKQSFVSRRYYKQLKTRLDEKRSQLWDKKIGSGELF